MHHLIFILNLLLISSSILYPIEAKKNSFSFDLIHHDSKSSPFYNQSKTESERSKEALIRSLNRLNHFNSSMSIDAKYVESDLSIGDYLMNIYISDEDKRLVIPSMTSILTWIRCGPCSSNCENQHQSLYDPKSSATYQDVPFDSEMCKYLQGTKRGESNVCRYEHNYGNGKSFSGVLGTETFYMQNANKTFKSFSNIMFGCDEGHEGDLENSVQGIVGLGQGKISLVSQLGKGFHKKFSYCLVEKSMKRPSKIKFGPDLTLYDREIEHKVKVQHFPSHPSYHLNLEAISFNGEKIKTLNKKQDMIVDIQTSLTSLPPNIYNALIAMFKKQVGNVTSIELPGYGTCFLQREIFDAKHPEIVFHFSPKPVSNGDFRVNPKTMFHTVGAYICLTIVPRDGVSILGNQAQVDVQMIFDLSSNLLTFAPLDCLKASI
ncbi:aspartic proteinase CDR1-like [Tripterygium wilfordii]|uniref:aspartic proteinase CDR1-like n=1 Tax=Tripterygium wilfordii TaxID=458696 RepID=UPI0018F7F858|nr:aspartic proteinase CDR1-like [Tripterygium wilfordii]